MGCSPGRRIDRLQHVVIEAGLTYLGMGVKPPDASWGNMLTNAQELIWSAPLLAIYPGLLIFVTSMACNVVSDAHPPVVLGARPEATPARRHWRQAQQDLHQAQNQLGLQVERPPGRVDRAVGRPRDLKDAEAVAREDGLFVARPVRSR